MKRILQLQPEAFDEIRSAAKWLNSQHAGTGQRFLNAVQTYLEQIERNPLLFGEIMENVRAVTIQRFHYVIIYGVLSSQTEIVAVVHGSRDKSAWLSRLQ